MIPKNTIEQIVLKQSKTLSEQTVGQARNLEENLPYLTDRALLIGGVRGSGTSSLLTRIFHNDYPEAWFTDFEDPRLAGFDPIDFHPTIGEAVLLLNNHRRIAKRRTPAPEELSLAESRPAPPLSNGVRKLRDLSCAGKNPDVQEIFEEEYARRPLFSEALFCSYWPSCEKAAIAMAVRDTAAEVTGRGYSMMCYPDDPVALLVNGDFDSMEDVDFILTLEQRFSIQIPDGDAAKLLNGTLAELAAEIHRRQTISQPDKENFPCSTNSSVQKAAPKS